VSTASLSTFPTYFGIYGAGGANTGGFYAMGDQWDNFPQGRDSGQGQIVDDYSWIHGKHAFKFGVNYRRNRVTDYTYEVGQVPSYFFNTWETSPAESPTPTPAANTISVSARCRMRTFVSTTSAFMLRTNGT
jgi:hypothetical protein